MEMGNKEYVMYKEKYKPSGTCCVLDIHFLRWSNTKLGVK